jgi:DNA-binding CsgD family transcriptional regulator
MRSPTNRAAKMRKADAAHLRRLRDLLGRYRPSARPIADELVHELTPVLDSEASLAMRPVRGELGWSADFVYATRDAQAVRDFLKTAQDGWSPFFPVTPEPLRNRAVRTKVIHRHLRENPSPAYKDRLDLEDRVGAGIDKDDLGVSVCDGELGLVWVGSTRAAPFGPRETAMLDALVPAMRARMLLEHQLGHARATMALLEAALDAIPVAAFFVAGASIEHANPTGRALLERDRPNTVDKLRESMRSPSPRGAFTITHVEAPGMRELALAVLRGDEPADFERRLAASTARHALTVRQRDVLALLARGYGNRTIAERIGVSEATVEEHVTNLFRKVRVDSRAELVAKFWSD